MRCSQSQGWPVAAIEFLDKNAIRKNECASCERNDGFKTEKIGSIGMFGDIPLNLYHLKDGGIAKEFVQHTIWSSGPMEWLGLKIHDKYGNLTNTILHPEEDSVE